jgi:hypothetical protein
MADNVPSWNGQRRRGGQTRTRLLAMEKPVGQELQVSGLEPRGQHWKDQADAQCLCSSSLTAIRRRYDPVEPGLHRAIQQREFVR